MKISVWSMFSMVNLRPCAPAPIAEIEREQVPRLNERMRVGGVRFIVREVEHLEGPGPVVRLYVERLAVQA